MAEAASRAQVKQYAIALSMPLLLTVGLLTIGRPLSSANAALLYQLAVLTVAIAAGLIPSMLTALLSVLAFHFFFVPAYFSFKLESGEDLVRLGVFLAVAITTSGLASRARKQTEAARRRAAETASLYDLSQLISAQVDLATILPTIAHTTCHLLNASYCTISITDADGTVCEQYSVGEAVVGGTATKASLRNGSAALGTLQIITAGDAQALSSHDRQLLDTLAAQASLAITRAHLVRQVARTEALAQSDQLKSALLTSVSHDLRTPLASIKGAATTLQSRAFQLPIDTQRSLVQTIEREIDQLDRTVQNLLDMSRLEAGTLELHRSWHELPELVGVVLQRLAPSLVGRPVSVQVDPDLPFVWANAILLEHVLTNLLENVVKYTPPESPVSITAFVFAGSEPRLSLAIRDWGPGIPPDELDQIFLKFYRGATTSKLVRGSGLGLTICHGIMAAHGGTIEAENRPDGGAVFTLSLPLNAPQSATALASDVIYEEEHAEDTRTHH